MAATARDIAPALVIVNFSAPQASEPLQGGLSARCRDGYKRTQETHRP